MRRSGLGAARRLLTLMLGLVFGVASPTALAETLSEKLEAIVSDSRVGSMRVGVRVMALRPEPRLVLDHHAEESFKPASNQKILTTAAALTLLGPDFTYRTVLARRGDDLVIIGAGDPSIGDPRMARKAGGVITQPFRDWADKLKALGITRIEGDLIFDDYVFDQEFVPDSWREQHNLESWYAAPVGGLNFNDNCVDLLIKLGDKHGEPAVITPIPNTPWIELVNKAKTAAKGEPLIRRTSNSPMKITVSGSVSRPNSIESPFSLPVTDPGEFFASTVRTVLASRGVAITGETRRERVRGEDGRLPDDLKIVATHESRIADFLWRVNKSSMNMFAEALLKSLGVYPGGRPSPAGVGGSRAGGRKAVLAFLEQSRLSTEHCVIDDGSGLSHTNRVTPAVVAGVLVRMDAHPARKLWRSNLAVPGEEEGTLRRRMRSLEGSVFAKTGSIRGVNCLSGYVVGPGGREYAFSVLCNDTHRAKNGTSSAYWVQRSVCQTLAKWGEE